MNSKPTEKPALTRPEGKVSTAGQGNAAGGVVAARTGGNAGSDRRAYLWFGAFAVVLCGCFARPLADLVRYSFHAAIHSHLVLIPLISGYLVWLKRHDPLPAASRSAALAIIPLAFGLVALNAYRALRQSSAPVALEDYLFLTVFAFVSFLWTGACFFLGGRLLRALAFPVAFLIFIVPMPPAMTHALEVFFQHASADAAGLMFGLTGDPVYRDGQFFRLPGISITVAEECSGIRSSLVLFITSLIAGHMFLRSPWRRAALTLFVIPLAILRNGFRIVSIAMLCVHVDPSMIDSPIHHRGGPLFFLLSLIPFFLFLFWLRKGERRHLPNTGESTSTI